MAVPGGRDRTEAFRETVRRAASLEGRSEAQMAKITSKFLLRQPVLHTPFHRTALDILGNVRTMQAFIARHHKDYLDRQRSTEREKDDIEHEVGLFMKACREQIDVLRATIVAEPGKPSSLSWLGLSQQSGSEPHVAAHQQGVVLYLSERLAAVAGVFDKMRVLRYQEALERREPLNRLRAKRDAGMLGNPDGGRSKVLDITTTEARGDGQAQILLQEDTRALQVELSSLMDSAREAESKMLEMSALSHLFSTHIVQQAHQIEQLYQQAVEATHNVEKGNKELVKTVRSNKDNRTFLLLFLIVASLALLFLDWYQ
eukprot:SM000154S01422  [mRNA]  locus=s154:270731:272748:- [translate_table: standard]